MNEIEEIISDIRDKKSRRDALALDIKEIGGTIEYNKKYLESAIEAQAILQSVALETQQEIEETISSIVTLALSSVDTGDASMPKPPKFVVRITEKRGAAECEFLFKEGNREQKPTECSGFGYVDIADYALRIVFIVLETEYLNKDISKILLLDEPFRNVDPELQYQVSNMVRMVSEDLGFQQIIVSHAKGLNRSAHKAFSVSKKDRKSIVSIANLK
jgi:hypothetical protein